MTLGTIDPCRILDTARRGLRVSVRAAPWGLIGMLALVAGIERSVVAGHEIDLLAPWHWDWRHTGRAVGARAARAEVLGFGDSLLKFGVYPAVVEHRIGRSTYNLAMTQGHPAASYFLLRRALAAGARPSAVLLDATPHILRINPAMEPILRQWPELLEPAEILDLAWTTRNPGLGARLLLAWLLPSVRDRLEARDRIQAALRGEPPTRRFTAPQYWRNIRVNRGAQVMPPIPFQGDLAALCRGLYPSWFCDPVNITYLDRFCALADARDIPVFWLLPPLTTEVQTLCEQTGFDAAHTAFIQGFQARHANVIVLDARRARYGQELHTDDPIHLNRLGGAVLSADVADALARHLAAPLAAPRWVTLPPYRPRAPLVPLEDVIASGQAIRRAGQVRR